jgi:hypothetical protein
MITRPIILLSCLLVGHGVIVAAEQLPDDIGGLIELLAISNQAAGNEPILTPSKDTPRDDPRVQAFAAAAELEKKGNSVFPQLLQHLDDKRQSVAFRRVIPHDVGDACFCIIRVQIFPVPRDYKGSFYRSGADGKLHARPLFFEPALFDKATLPKWLEKRKDKSLREMQIEALTWLIDQERKIGFRNEKDKALYLFPLERRLDEIKTGKPLTEPGKKAPQNPFEF